jgi:hypothetical protein
METLEDRMIKLLCFKMKEYSDMCECQFKDTDRNVKNKFGVDSKRHCDYKTLARMLNYVDTLIEEL